MLGYDRNALKKYCLIGGFIYLFYYLFCYLSLFIYVFLLAVCLGGSRCRGEVKDPLPLSPLKKNNSKVVIVIYILIVTPLVLMGN